MLFTRSTRRNFAARLASLFPGLGLAAIVAAAPAAAAQSSSAVQKLDGDGKPAGKGFITPLIIHNGLIYIAGQGAHSRGNKSDAGKTPTIEMHTQMVMEHEFSIQDLLPERRACAHHRGRCWIAGRVARGNQLHCCRGARCKERSIEPWHPRTTGIAELFLALSAH